jgi:hypothetical protein
MHMYQKDYILRIIEQVGKLIAGILGMIKKGEFSRASEEISDLYSDILREDAAFFRTIPEDELTNKLLNEHNYSGSHLEILAALFNAEAELELAQGKKTGSLEYFRKSLILYEFIDNEYRTYSAERLFQIESIRVKIAELIKSA